MHLVSANRKDCLFVSLNLYFSTVKWGIMIFLKKGSFPLERALWICASACDIEIFQELIARCGVHHGASILE